MMNFKNGVIGLLALAGSSCALATDGYFSLGYGVKSQAMGGVGIALPQDSIAAASNPAGMALVGSRMDFGATLFRPIRGSDITGNAGGTAVNGSYDANETNNFIIPEFGYNRAISPDLTLGVSVYANGGMNTDYARAVPLFDQTGQHRAGVDLAQLFIAPALAWKLSEANTVGVALNLVYQLFEARGLQNFDNPQMPYTTALGNVSDNGHAGSHGVGVHIGWIGKINDTVSLGATYQSKTSMSNFDKYKGLFAEQGGFDIPESYGVGISLLPMSGLTLAADLEQINYSAIKSVGNLSLANLGNGLGADNGAGFGWQDVTVFKAGVSYAWNESLVLRAGYNHSSQPIPAGETLFNILAPGVVEDHITFGLTWILSNKSELTVGYVHAFSNTVYGHNSIPAGFGGGEANLHMHQDSLGIAYGWGL